MCVRALVCVCACTRERVCIKCMRMHVYMRARVFLCAGLRACIFVGTSVFVFFFKGTSLLQSNFPEKRFQG